MCWNGMYFRSKAELKIAQMLQQRGVLFFANSQGTASLTDLPVTRDAHGMVERIEADSLVFLNGQCICLEVDSQHHLNGKNAYRDFAKERVLLREQTSTVRFPAQECLAQPDEVVTEFLNLFAQR